MSGSWLRNTLRGTALLALPLGLVAVLANAFASPATVRIVTSFFMTTIFVLAIQIFSGNSGIPSFGHVGFMAVGAYVAAILTILGAEKETMLPSLPPMIAHIELDFLPAILVSALVAAAIAAVIGLPLTRMREGALPLATIGILIIIFLIVENWTGVTRGLQGVFGVPRNTTLYRTLTFTIITVAVCRGFSESKIGKMLHGSREDPLAAEALGVDVVRVRWIAWILSGALMGMGGALWAQYNLAFGPKQFYFPLTVNLLAMLVVGGMGSVSGTIVGTTLLTVVSELMRRVEGMLDIGGIAQIIVALSILFVLYWRPDGLLGKSEVDSLLEKRLPWLNKSKSGGVNHPQNL